MRRKPITRDEIRIADNFGGGSVMTLPADSVRLHVDFPHIRAIPRLWAPLLKEMQQREDDAIAWTRRMHPGMKIRARREYRTPNVWFEAVEQSCSHCGAAFFNAGRYRSRFCSDRCLKSDKAKANSKTRSEARAADRADLRCRTCKEPLEAARSTARYCSVRCRVKAHRRQANSRNS